MKLSGYDWKSVVSDWGSLLSQIYAAAKNRQSFLQIRDKVVVVVAIKFRSNGGVTDGRDSGIQGFNMCPKFIHGLTRSASLLQVLSVLLLLAELTGTVLGGLPWLVAQRAMAPPVAIRGRLSGTTSTR